MTEAVAVESPLLGGETGVGLCGDNTPPTPSPEGSMDTQDRIVKHIMCKLTAFDAAVKASKLLEIDGLAIEDGTACDKVTQEAQIKILNNHNEAAYMVSVDTIVRQPLKDLILALETGLFTRLHGVTRIVGYFSRIANWNSSKIGELHDRHKGDYAVGTAEPQITQISQIEKTDRGE